MAVTQSLTVSEVADSHSVGNNTSRVRIVWNSIQSGSSYNNYTRTAYYWITTPDGVETKYSVSYTLPLSATQTILDKTITVTHKDDGSGTVSVRTWMDTDISAGIVELGPKTVTLETIPRASEITSAEDVLLGTSCSVKWTPKSASFRYKLKFSMGDWSYTTGAIHPNKTSAYTYTGYTVPLSVANQISSAKTGTMTVTLYTYSDSGASTRVGDADAATFAVTVPDSSSTQPSVSMTVTPVASLPAAFAGLYIQGKTKVKAALEATGKYGATIKSYSMKAEGMIYDADDDYTSDYLSQYGSITVYGYAKDTRGLTGSTSKTIAVIGYSKPQILPKSGGSEVVAARCDASGNLTDNGTYLKIKAKRNYSPVVVGGVQKNFCKVQYRYKVNGGTYSSWATILAATSLGSDEVETGALLGGALAVDTAYLVQVQAIDDVGEYARTTISVPTDKVYWHRDGARRSFAFGGYVEEDDTFSIAEGITFKTKGPIYAQGGGNVDCLKVGARLVATAGSPLSLDNLKTPGSYYSPNAETSQYISASPRGNSGGFGLRVRELQNGSYIRQEQYYGRTTWVRHWDGNVWSDWLRYLTTTIDETPVADYVIDEGVSGDWTYKKWKNGTYELFGTFTVTPTSSTVNGSLYRTNNMTISVPFAISSAYVSGTVVGYYWITNGGKSGDSAITLRLMSDKTFSTTTAIEVRLMVVGSYA